jgi:phosphatidyl-myo-inositol dimannoside synthase
VVAALQSKPCDRILTSSWSPFAVDLPGVYGDRVIPRDILCHGMDLLEPSRSLRYRMLLYHTLRSASLVIANSQFTGEAARRLGARAEQIAVIPPGVDPDRFRPGPRQTALLERHRIADSSPIVLSLGRLVARKGFDLVMRALPQVLTSFPETVYLVAGDGPDRHRLETFAAALGVKSQVRFTGALADEELPAYYNCADLFAMPSRYIESEGDVEGFGMVFLEAGCSGVPVVGGKSGGIQDAVVDGITGYLVDPESPQECAAKIIALLSDPELGKRMGAAARRRALDQFQWPQITARYANAFAGMAASQRAD